MARGNKTNRSRAGRLRIVAGIWRSRLLDIADVPGLRPTSERIRETLFNWLAPNLHGARCLDLFAGTGALGLEALSRGAREVVFVERTAAAVDTLRANVEALAADDATIVRADAGDYLDSRPVEPFDIVFLDPPFADDALAATCRLLDARGWVEQAGLVYLEQDRVQSAPELPAGWDVLRDKTAGNVRYMLVRREA